jgi:glycosyltransferase involved in cell wall biosynthesis
VPKVSLCLIVKNEEAHLPACLASAADLVDEIILVDTGSTDATKEVAARFNARIYDFPWINNFAAARNESLRHATGDWIFWLDADDRIDEDNRRRLRALLAGLQDENAAYFMRCLCTNDATKAVVSVIDQIRLFRNRPNLRWKYRIHEHIALDGLNYALRRADVNILHVGYQDAAVGPKRERNLQLLKLEDAERPNDPYILLNLGLTCHGMGLLQEALQYYRRSLQYARADQDMRKLYAMLAKVNRELGQPAEALRICREGRTRYSEDPELLTQEAWVLYLLGDNQGTENRLLQLLQEPSQPDGSIEFGADPGLRGYLTRHNLAVLYKSQNRFAEAEAQWRAGLAEQPNMTDAWLGLGELYQAQGRWQDMEEVLIQLEAMPHAQVQAAVLRSQKQLFHREFAAARQLLEKTIAANPKALGPRIVLSRVHLAEGRDLAAAEKSLNDVLALDPNNDEARRNLAYLQQQPR